MMLEAGDETAPCADCARSPARATHLAFGVSRASRIIDPAVRCTDIINQTTHAAHCMPAAVLSQTATIAYITRQKEDS